MRQAEALVQFYDSAPDEALKFAVILAKHQGKWVFCKHRERETWEIPGGHREPGEAIEQTARRELYEETGAVDFNIEPLFVYSVTAPWNFDGRETFGMVFLADVTAFEPDLHSEIERIQITDELPTAWTYPEIQPRMLEEYFRRASASQRKENSAKAADLTNLVSVVIDRPLGSKHPKHPDIVYPVNYGFVPGVLAPDGEEQDVYVLGVDQPLTTFTGQKIAVIHRADDVEDKWVLAPAGKRFTAGEIVEAVRFQEQYFQSEVELCV